MLLSSHSENKSIKSILKGKGPKLEPCGTPSSILDLSLKHSLILNEYLNASSQKKIVEFRVRCVVKKKKNETRQAYITTYTFDFSGKKI